MGLLDWLTGGTGFESTFSPFVSATNNYTGPGGEPDMGPTSLNPTPPTPQPDASPQVADVMQPPQAAAAPPLPPPINVGAPPPVAEASGPAPAPPAPGPMPGQPMDLSPPQQDGLSALRARIDALRGGGGGVIQPGEGGGGSKAQAQTFLGRALGLDPNTERQLRGSLASGLAAVGNSAGKSPLAAFASGAGAGIQGGMKADEKTTAEQDKYLSRAIEAFRAGNTEAYQTNYLKYQIEATKARLEANKAKAAGKDSVLNSNEQLYLRGLTAVSQDPKVKLSAEGVKELQKTMGADSPELKAAIEAHDKLVSETRNRVFQTLGVNEKDAAAIAKKPGFSRENPVPKEGLTQEKFDNLPDGTYFINPSDGRILIKRPRQQAPMPGLPQNPGAGLTPPLPPLN